MIGVLLTLIACSGSKGSDSGSGSEGLFSAQDVFASITLLDVMNNYGVADMGISYEEQLQSTDGNGQSTVSVEANAPFHIEATAQSFMTHRLNGVAGDEDFSVSSFVISRPLLGQIYSTVGLTEDGSKGVLIVVLEHADSSAAEGASVSIDGSYDESIAFSEGTFLASNTLPSGGKGLLCFANVAVGSTTISVDPPSGERCWLAPAGGASAAVEILADETTVALFQCAPE